MDILVVPELQVDVSKIIGNSGEWNSFTSSASFAHINALENDQQSIPHLPFRHGIIKPDIQKITISYRNIELESSLFTLSCLGYENKKNSL